MSPPWLRPLCVLFLAGARLWAQADDDGWQRLTEMRPAEAAAAFAAAPAGDRAAAYGAAAALLAQQPRTEANIARAEAALDALADGLGDDVAVAAAYLAARCRLDHRDRPDEAGGRALLARLAEARPETYHGQLAVLKLATLDLYEPGVPPPERLRRARAVADALTPADGFPEVRRNFHLLLGEAALRFGWPSAFALEHLQAARASSFDLASVEADVLLQVAQAARADGREALAAEAYEAFAAGHPRDKRAQLARETAARLRAGENVRP